MREPTVARDRERGLPGVIDTLSAGYATVNRHPWIIAIPILLDLLLWLGPRLSLAPLVQRSLGDIPIPAGLSAEMLQTYQNSREGLLEVAEGFNLLALLVAHFPGIPSLMAGGDGLGPVLGMNSSWAAFGLFILLPLVGIWMGSLYYSMVGLLVRGSGEDAGELLGRVRRTWGRLVAFALIALAIGLLVGLPLGVVAFLAGAVNSGLLGLAAAIMWMTFLWLQFYLFFVVDAMVVSDVGPMQAVRNSVTVVRFNLGSTLGLVLLVWVITLGMPIVWDVLAESTVGTIVGILGNAYILTGLAVASMTYYRDRFAALGVRD